MFLMDIKDLNFDTAPNPLSLGFGPLLAGLSARPVRFSMSSGQAPLPIGRPLPPVAMR